MIARVAVLAVAVAVLAFAGSAAGDTGILGLSGDTLIVATTHTPSDATVIALGWTGSAPMANIEFDVPAGYTLDVGQAPGAKLADVVLVTKNSDIAEGTLSAADPTTTSTCDAQPHVSVWNMSVTAIGPAINVPWFVDAGANGGYVMHVCLPAAAFGASATPIESLLVSFGGAPLNSPTVPGTYLWHAIVTPFGPDGQTPASAPAADLQANVPLPATLTMKAKYNAHTKVAVVTGRLMLGGQPASGYTIDLGAAATKGALTVTSKGTAETAANGTFSFPVRLSKTSYIFASPEATQNTCTSTVAAECFVTELPLADAIVHAVVPKPKPKPKPKKKKHT